MRRNSEQICAPTALHWGWRDADLDGRVDVTAAPQLQTVDPVLAPPGKSVRLAGPGMRFATRVRCGGVDAPSAFINPGGDEVAAEMPPGPDGILAIEVDTIAGRAAPPVGDVFVIRGSAVAPPPPQAPAIFGVSPNHGRTGDRITLLGANLLTTTHVRFGLTDAPEFDAGESDIEVTVPLGFGVVPVTASNAVGTSVPFPLSMFTYDP
jgi:hypothetical protein